MFTISEFSKIALVPVTQLRYYEKIGLFRPQHVDDLNSYRYYTVEQLPELSRIIALKALGLSLENIMKLVQEEVSSEEIKGMYALRKAQIEQNLIEEQNRLKVVETRLKQLDHLATEDREDVSLKSVPAQSFISLRETFADRYEIMQTLLELKTHAKERLGAHVGQLTAVRHDEAFSDQNQDLELGFVLPRMANQSIELPGGRLLRPSELPALETVVSLVCVGSIDMVFLKYGDLGEWLAKHNHAVTTPHREVMIVPPLPNKTDHVVIEIQMPVQLKS